MEPLGQVLFPKAPVFPEAKSRYRVGARPARVFVHPGNWHLQQGGYFVDSEEMAFVPALSPCGPVYRFD